MKKNSYTKLYQNIMSGVSLAFPILILGTFILAVNSLLITTSHFNIENLGHIILKLVAPITAYGITDKIHSKRTAVYVMLLVFIDNRSSILTAILYSIVFGSSIKAIETKTDKFQSFPLYNTIFIPFVFLFGTLISIIFGKALLVLDDFMYITINNEYIKLLILIALSVGIVLDLGGPINKITSLIANSLFLRGFHQAIIVKMSAGMIAPIGIGIAKLLYKSSRKEGKALIRNGLIFYTEELISYQEKEPFRIKISTISGVVIDALLIYKYKIHGYAVQGGIIMSLTYKPLTKYLMSILISSIIVCIIYLVFPFNENKVDNEEFDLENYLEEI